jgi:hypothetical protein
VKRVDIGVFKQGALLPGQLKQPVLNPHEAFSKEPTWQLGGPPNRPSFHVHLHAGAMRRLISPYNAHAILAPHAYAPRTSHTLLQYNCNGWEELLLYQKVALLHPLKRQDLSDTFLGEYFLSGGALSRWCNTWRCHSRQKSELADIHTLSLDVFGFACPPLLPFATYNAASQSTRFQKHTRDAGYRGPQVMAFVPMKLEG